MSRTILSWIEARRTGTNPVSLQIIILGSSEIIFRLIDKVVFRCLVAKRVSDIGTGIIVVFYELSDKIKLTSVWLNYDKYFSVGVWLEIASLHLQEYT